MNNMRVKRSLMAYYAAVECEELPVLCEFRLTLESGEKKVITWADIDELVKDVRFIAIMAVVGD